MTPDLDGRVDLTEGMTAVPDSYFAGCNRLRDLYIPASVVTIGSNAFDNCELLVNIHFGHNSQLTTVGSYAFRNAKTLPAVTLPKLVTSVGVGAFEGASALRILNFAAGCANTVYLQQYALLDTSQYLSLRLPSTATCFECPDTITVEPICVPTTQPSAAPAMPSSRPTALPTKAGADTSSKDASTTDTHGSSVALIVLLLVGGFGLFIYYLRVQKPEAAIAAAKARAASSASVSSPRAAPTYPNYNPPQTQSTHTPGPSVTPAPQESQPQPDVDVDVEQGVGVGVGEGDTVVEMVNPMQQAAGSVSADAPDEKVSKPSKRALQKERRRSTQSTSKGLGSEE